MLNYEHSEYEALQLLKRIVKEYPGILDGVTEVSGADLVGDITSMLQDYPTLESVLNSMIKKV